MPRISWSLHTEPDQADQHAPQDRHDFMRAAVELVGRGLTPDDIASALRITRRGVLELLADYAQQQARPHEIELGHLTRRRRHG